MDSGQSGVAGGVAVAAFVFEMVEKRRDHRDIQVCEVEFGRCLADVLLDEPQQEAEAVTVGGNGVRAGATLGEALGEIALQDGSEGGHEASPCAASSRRAMCCISSGAACKYQ
jgi:hypothetical protein